MSYIIDDGQGSTSKVSVLDNHLKTFDCSCSLLNHISTEANGRIPMLPEPNTNAGVFTLRANRSGSFGIGGTDILNIVNVDTENLILIDRLVVQIVSSSLTLPDPRYIAELVVINRETLFSQIIAPNDNQSINILPSAFSSVAATGQVKALFRVYPTVGIPNEMIPQNSDGLILSYGNGIRLQVGGMGGTFTIEGFVRFAIGDFEEFS